MAADRARLSAFVISYNRATLIGSCLRALRFADELIVVDKSSTDDTASIAARLADRVITVPWTPTADDTRGFAMSQCSHDWILFADDDEIFSREAVAFIESELREQRADIYEFARREYILGMHDPNAYYWPEHQIRLFRRGAIQFCPTIHVCMAACSDRIMRVPADGGACIHHLSHQDVAQWLEKANRYTSCADRARAPNAGNDIAAFAHARIDHWLARTHDTTAGSYPQAVALLRATYDLIDRLKIWEEERGLSAAAAFRAICATLDAAHADAAPRGAGTRSEAMPEWPVARTVDDALRASLLDLRRQHDAATAAHAAREDELTQQLAEARDHVLAVQARAAGEVAEADARADAAMRQAAASTSALRAIETSTFWRATAWPRRVAGRLRARR